MKIFSIFLVCTSIVLTSSFAVAESCEGKKHSLEEKIFFLHKEIAKIKKGYMYPYDKPQVDGGLVVGPWLTCEEIIEIHLTDEVQYLEKKLAKAKEEAEKK